MQEVINYITSVRFFVSVAVVLAAVIIRLVVGRAFRRFDIEDVQDVRQRGKVNTVRTLFRAVLSFFVVLVVLQINEINVTSLMASLGLVSAVVGLAMQDIIKDVIMGLHIRADGFCRTGDVVHYRDTECVVTKTGIRSVKLMNIEDHAVTTVCNRNISELTVLSDTLEIDVPLPYELSADRALAVLGDIAAHIAAVDGVTACEPLGVYAFDASAIRYRLHITCPPEERLRVRVSALGEICRGLAVADIVVPYQQIDIHTK